MARPRSIPEQPLRHTSSQRAYVRLHAHPAAKTATMIYLGHWPHGEKEPPPDVMEAFHKTVGGWLANGRRLIASEADGEGVTVVELILQFLDAHEHALPPRSVANYRSAFGPLRKAFGDTVAAEFTPLNLRAVRDMLLAGAGDRRRKKSNTAGEHRLSQRYVNDMMARMRRLFSWAASEGLIPHHVFAALEGFGGVRRNDPRVTPPTPRETVDMADVEAIKPHVSTAVYSAVQVLLLTGARPDEILSMSPCDIDTTPDEHGNWRYTPQHHKTAHHGKERIIDLGPRAQRIIAPLLDRPDHAYLFSPREAVIERARVGSTSARRPDQRPNPCKTKRRVGRRYRVDSLRQAIVKACKKAGIKPWTPYQLRHTDLTRVSDEFGPEHAKARAGHSTLNTLRFYDHADRQRAARIAAAIG